MAEVDLLLARRVFVEGVLDRDTELLELADRLLSQVTGSISCREIEVPASVEGPRWLTRLRLLEVEELDIGSDVEGETLGVGGLDMPAEHLARIAMER